MIVTEIRQRAAELAAQITPASYKDAIKTHGSLSAWLEREDPSAGYGDGLDAFQRQLKVAGIRAKSVPHAGIVADDFGKFFDSPQGQALGAEYLARQWRSVAAGGAVSMRALVTSTEGGVGSARTPYADALELRGEVLEPAIPLSALIGRTTVIDRADYRSLHTEADTAENLRMVRVSEGAEIPRVKLTTSDQVIRLKKYGRAIEYTYEQARRTPIDVIGYHVRRMAVQAENDKVAAALDVAVNGDGNSGTAATSYNLTTLDAAASAGTLTLKAWLAFKMKFPAPYMMTTALTPEGIALQMFLLSTGSANIPLVTIQGMSAFGALSQLNRSLADGVAVGWTADAPANKIVGLDARMALERVVERGGQLTETARWVTRQTEALVFSEVEGYAVMDADATRVLNVGA